MKLRRFRARPALRIGTVGAAMLLGTAAFVAPAYAAAPSNDDPSAAAPVSLGDHITLDTTEATTTAFDSEVNANCGAPETKASVWYTYTASEDGGVVLDMSSSSYSGGFLVFDGAPTADSLIDCGAETLGFTATAGSTYTIMALDDDTDGNTANGGTLVLDVTAAPPLPTVAVTVAPTGRVTKDGTAWITGTYTCTDAGFIELDGELHQAVGRFTINGSGFVFDEGTCDGTPHKFTMGITADNGKFAGGKAASIVFSFACGSFDCSDGYVEQTVKLSKGGR